MSILRYQVKTYKVSNKYQKLKQKLEISRLTQKYQFRSVISCVFGVQVIASLKYVFYRMRRITIND